MIEILQGIFTHNFGVAAPEIPIWFIYALLLTAVVISTTVHEFGHAWMADKLGDPTPRNENRVRLSPFAHMDPWGFAILVVTLFIGFPIGWGRPVRTNPENYKCGERKGIALVALAGPMMNLLVAAILAPFARMALDGVKHGDETALIALLGLSIIMLVNISLFCFNLVPIHPLDGSHIMASILPEPLSKPYRFFMQRYGVYLLLTLVATRVLGKFIEPMVLALFRFFVGL
jgi:Zn-dependent protease